MAYYRLYFLDGSGRIQEFREFEAEEDFAAIRQAAEWRSIGSMELWCCDRVVRRWRSMSLPPLAPSRADWSSRT